LQFLTDQTYETLSGTSMAAPAITGLIVLLQQHYKTLILFYEGSNRKRYCVIPLMKLGSLKVLITSTVGV
jgi:hypothetical protein